MSLADRVVLITGATGGLGRVATARFAAEGARLALAGTDRGRLQALAAEIGLKPDRWTAAVGDLRDADDALRVVAEAAKRLGPVDVVLHCVGGWTGGKTVVELDPGELRSMLEQHLWTTLNVARAVVPSMTERGWGRIVGVSSPFASTPGARMSAYGVAKAGEEVLLGSLAREVGASGVTANVLVVRKIDVEHARETEPSDKNRSWTTPEEIANAMVFLSSDESAAINGARIPLYNRD
jgi:NAD(P)-dependent dehydrogenase (short-subunit alcohol dehydrogenase family)